MKTHIQSILGIVATLALVIPAGLIQAQSNIFSDVGGGGVAMPANQSSSQMSWQGGNCTNEQSQLIQMQDSFNQKQNDVTTMKQQISQIYDQVNTAIANGVGPYALKISPTNPAAGSNFTVTATFSSSTMTAYTLELLKDGQILTTFTTNTPVGVATRPTTITKDFLMPGTVQSGGYSLRMRDPSNLNIKSILDFLVL